MENKHPQTHSVHKVLAHSYAMYFVLFLMGVILDSVFEFKIFTDSIMVSVGLFFLIISSGLIIWAQKTGHDFSKVQEVRTEHFCRGPYCYTRTPTQWGLFLLVLGFGIITNAFFVILTTFLSLIISKSVFVKKQEKILEQKYGTHYLEYKKLVKF